MLVASLERMTTCNDEEAGSRIFVHARHAVADGLTHTSLIVKASDTDFLVITISVFHEKSWLLQSQSDCSLYCP